MLEKNRVEKVRKHVFFYKNTYIVTKKWGKKTREKFFSRNTRISRAKNDGKKSSRKSAKTRFFYKHTNIVTKKSGEKTREKFFQKHTNSLSKKVLEKIVWKKCKNTFF